MALRCKRGSIQGGGGGGGGDVMGMRCRCKLRMCGRLRRRIHSVCTVHLQLAGWPAGWLAG